MEKEERTPFGRRLFDARTAAGYTQENAAKAVEMAQGTLAEAEIFGKRSGFTPQLAALYGVDAEWLATGKGRRVAPEKPAIDLDDRPEYIPVKRVRFKLSAGISGFEIEYLNGNRAPIFFRQEWIDERGFKADTLLAVSVSGASMEPSLFDGDLVVVNTADQSLADGEVFAFNYEGELVVKRLVRNGGEWFLSSDNQDKRRYPDKRCDERTSIIGRVVYKQSERI